MLPTIYGAVIVGGIFGLIVAPFVGRMQRFFPPTVTGTVILVIGLSLMRIAIDWAAGGQPSDVTHGQPSNLGIALLTLVTIFMLIKFSRGRCAMARSCSGWSSARWLLPCSAMPTFPKSPARRGSR
jgi:NCS2 family nucleobase:cation symporter-2